MIASIARYEIRLAHWLAASVGAPYKFGGRGPTGIDCSSLLMRAIRKSLRLTVAQLPWMTADQMARGRQGVTVQATEMVSAQRCLLAFFDWYEDGIHEHAAACLPDGSWIWASTSAGKVIRVDPRSTSIWDRQWREIEGALDGRRSTLRMVDWRALGAIR